MRTVAIGSQGFEFVRKNGYFYIDKTDFIKEWWETGDSTTLITRPRRFGKTFNLSMLDCFFSTRYKDRGDLFEGLNIWKEEEYHAIQGTYPVISMSFGSIKGNNFKDTKAAIIDAISDVYEQHAYLKNSGVLTEDEVKQYDMFKRYSMGVSADCQIEEQTVKKAVFRLSEFLERYHKKKVIILLDEYDTPMQEAYVGDYWDEVVSFFRGMFNITFKENLHLERAIMAGITRVSKESIFSDLNHLKVITTTSDKYETYFGFTEDEVFAALDEADMSDQKQKVKSWYDGFTFGRYRDIYNPWSIINFLDEKKYEPYWADTSSNGLVSKLIRTGNVQVKETMHMLLEGQCLETQIDEQIVFKNIDRDETAIWSLLLASGYLKVDSYTIDKRTKKKTYQLKLTNFEVEQMFERLINEWFRGPSGNYSQFNIALLKGNLEDINYYLQEIVENTISSFDVGGSATLSLEDLKQLLLSGAISFDMFLEEQAKLNKKTNPELFYHALVL